MSDLNKIKNMMKLQNEMNCSVDLDWKKLNRNWLLAALVEAVELIDHVGYKWWGKQELNLKQAQYEVVDCLHFLLSYAIEKKVEADLIEEILNTITFNVSKKVDKENILIKVEQFLRAISLKEKVLFIFSKLFFLAESLNLDFNTLYKMYIGKNVLNKFRQDNGYKTGTYNKLWKGKEDNIYLEEILSSLNSDISEDNIFKHIYMLLAKVYKENNI